VVVVKTKTKTLFLLLLIFTMIVCMGFHVVPEAKATGTYTMGITTILASTDDTASSTLWLSYHVLAANNGTLTKFTFYTHCVASTGEMTCGLYSQASGKAYGRINVSSSVVVGTSFSWVDFPFASGTYIVAGTEYWLAFMGNQTWGYRYNNSATTTYDYKTGEAYPNFPNPVSPSVANYHISIYATYSEGDSTPPTYSSIDKSSTLMNTACVFSCKWTDDTGLSGYIFGTNNSGSWVNETWATLTGNPAWANVTKTLTNNFAYVVIFRWYANDTSNNWGDTGNQTFTTTASITFQFNTGGIIERNGTVIANSTSMVYSAIANLSMSALPTVNYTLLTWNTSDVSSTDNPYIFTITKTTTLWCYFFNSSIYYDQGYSAGYSTGYSDGWNAGNATGYSDGYSVGYPIGYAVGYADGLGNATGGIFIYARFTINDTAPYQNQDTVFFNASLSNCSSLPLSYYWDFGDLSNSTGETTTHIYLSSGVFIVNLTVVNGAMSDTMFQNITVFATSINITFDWNDLLFGSGAWLPFIAIMIAMFVGVAINKWFVVAALPIMALMSFLYFDHITTTPSLVWEALIMMCSAIVLLLYSASKK
jgi:hypothetical protein